MSLGRLLHRHFTVSDKRYRRQLRILSQSPDLITSVSIFSARVKFVKPFQTANIILRQLCLIVQCSCDMIPPDCIAATILFFPAGRILILFFLIDPFFHFQIIKLPIQKLSRIGNQIAGQWNLRHHNFLLRVLIFPFLQILHGDNRCVIKRLRTRTRIFRISNAEHNSRKHKKYSQSDEKLFHNPLLSIAALFRGVRQKKN